MRDMKMDMGRLITAIQRGPDGRPVIPVTEHKAIQADEPEQAKQEVKKKVVKIRDISDPEVKNIIFYFGPNNHYLKSIMHNT